MTAVTSTPFSIAQNKGLQTNLSREEQARQAAQEFESVFLSQMLSGMFEAWEETNSATLMRRTPIAVC
ncbi:hypothetical protein [Cohaesibacter marisflavi]|uniref:hypothetical protein n=1 Tax=Cohaesibacter marisflavi TaxID=655353 RepID=UPI0029C706A1|nr:hypothetical protein [Cohaesibacter marisflavi]